MGLSKYELIIFDADGTLRRCTVPGQPCPNKDGEWALMPNVGPYIGNLVGNYGFKIGIASNQAGVALGYLTDKEAIGLCYDLLQKISTPAIDVVGESVVRICPHSPEAQCLCRKPAPGLLFDIMEFWHYSNRRTLMVGDMESDRQAAINAGCDFMWAKDFFGWER